MKINVQAHPVASEERIDQIDETTFAVWVREPPRQGRANAAIIQALAAHFKVAPSRVRILTGHTSRYKVVEIL